MPRRFNARSKEVGLREGWRSGLELQEQDRFQTLGIEYVYEGLIVPWTPLKLRRKYKADFLLLRNFIVIETKGRFETSDRQKHLAIQAEYPDLDLRFVFSNPNQRISKQSQTTYAKWCDTHGFKYAAKTTPIEWLKEPLNARSKAIIQKLLTGDIK